MDEWCEKHDLSAVPRDLWRRVASKLCERLVMDAGESLAICENDEKRWVVATKHVRALEDVWIIDHMATFGKVDNIDDSFRTRLVALAPGSTDAVDVLWRFARPLPRAKYEAQCFYVEDEVGCAILTEGEVNVGSALLVDKEETFTLVWPQADLAEGDVLVREPTAAQRALRQDASWSLAWQSWQRQLEAWEDTAAVVVEDSKAKVAPLPTAVKVFTDMAWVREHLHDPRFELVDDRDEADVLFVASGGKDFRVRPGQLTSFYDYEACLIRKDHLAMTLARSGLASHAPETYDLDTQLDAALGAIALDETQPWIVKPATLGRSMGVAVTRSKHCVAAHALAGLHVLQRYVNDPVTLDDGRKFDVRIVVMLRSAQPLELYAHDTVFIRAANKPHNVATLDDDEVALTAMHLIGKEPNHPSLASFRARHFPEGHWPTALLKCHVILREVFAAAAALHSGFADSSPRSRAMYGCDFLFEKAQDGPQPRLLEVTYNPAFLAMSPSMPDQYPDFADDCFRCLFLGEQNRVQRL